MAWRYLSSLFPVHSLRSIVRERQWRLPLPQVESGRHTIRSHGASLAKDYRHDWLVLLFLIVMEIVLFVIHPFYRFVGKDMMTDLKYPLKDNTVPIWAVPMYAVLLPIAIFLLVYIRRRDVYDLHHGILGDSICYSPLSKKKLQGTSVGIFFTSHLIQFQTCQYDAGLLYSVLITAVITDAIKNATGRPRPDFFWRCFPDGVERYDKLGGVICHGKAIVVKEGHKSFPSGHTSWSFAGLGFLSLYLSGKIKAFDRKGHIAKLCIAFLPLLVASLVAVSRVDDYWHHWQDVFAGGLLGLVVATFCYHQFFPPPYDDQGWGPYAYFHAIESSQANSTTLCPANALSVQVMEAQAVNRQVIGYYGETLVGHEPSGPLDIESTGR